MKNTYETRKSLSEERMSRIINEDFEVENAKSSFFVAMMSFAPLNRSFIP